MKRAFCFITLLCLAMHARAAVDLTPVAAVREQDGIKFPELRFKDGTQKITYEQPTGWTYTGDSSHIRFVPPNMAQAHAEIAQSPLPAPQNFDEPTMKALQEQIVASIPKDASEIALISAEKNPLVMSGHETFEVVVSYQAYGTRFVTGTLFMNLKDTQLRFRVISKKEDFEKIHKLFRGSLYSWQSEDNGNAR